MCNFVAVIDHKLVMQMQIESMWRCDNVSGLGEHVTFLGIALSLLRFQRKCMPFVGPIVITPFRGLYSRNFHLVA